MSDTPKTALIIGASRGLGLGLAGQFLGRGWNVVATVRQPSAELDALGATASGRLRTESGVDIDHPEQVRDLCQRLAGARFDLLFINAGVNTRAGETIDVVPDAEVLRLYMTNAVSPVRTAETLAELVDPAGTIGFMTSILGSIAAATGGGHEAYRASKVALNMLVRCFGARAAGKDRTLLLLHPGWVRTDMGGPQAVVDVDTSTSGLADVITARLGSGGLAYLDYTGKEIAW